MVAGVYGLVRFYGIAKLMEDGRWKMEDGRRTAGSYCFTDEVVGVGALANVFLALESQVCEQWQPDGHTSYARNDTKKALVRIVGSLAIQHSMIHSVCFDDLLPSLQLIA